MMAIIGTIIFIIGIIKSGEIAICGAVIMSSGYLGLVLDNLQKNQSELIKGIINNLRK